MTENYAKLNEVSISEILPQGWLKKFLEYQENGITGHLCEIGEPFSTVGWDRPVTEHTQGEIPHWWPYEQTGYLTDGTERCGQLLKSKKLLERSGKSIEYVLENADDDGFLGPKFLKENTENNRWPLVVFFRTLMARYSACKDKRILDAITRHYLECKLDYSVFRDVDNVEIMLWAYLQNGNKELLKLAEETYEKYNKNCKNDTCDRVALSDKKPYEHGVTYNEYSKLGAILYLCTGKEQYLKASVAAYRKIDRYFMLASGLHCSNEYMRSNHYLQSHETCDVSDYTWSLGYLLMATGDGKYADKIEKCVFNAGIGSVDEEFKALQYFSCPNQLVSDTFSNHNVYNRGSKWMAYRQIPGTQCCPGNVNRFFPNYCARMWMQKDGCLYSVLYGASVYENEKVCVRQETNYPFTDDIKFSFSLKRGNTLDFCFRIPSWCHSPKLKINGIAGEFSAVKGFVKITVRDKDIVELSLPADIEVQKYGENGRVVSRGALVYCFGMYGKRVPSALEKPLLDGFPVNDFSPDKDWNYALVSDNPQDYKLCRSKPSDNNVWDIRECSLKIKCPAVKIKDWKLEHFTQVEGFTFEDGIHPVRPFVRNGNYTFTPHFPRKNTLTPDRIGDREEIELVPMGLAKLRMTVFMKTD